MNGILSSTSPPEPVTPRSCCCSTTSPASSSCSSIEDIKNDSNFGSTTKKRKVLKKCSEVRASLSDVTEK